MKRAEIVLVVDLAFDVDNADVEQRMIEDIAKRLVIDPLYVLRVTRINVKPVTD